MYSFDPEMTYTAEIVGLHSINSDTSYKSQYGT